MGRVTLTEGQLHNIIKKCINEAFKSKKLQRMYNDNGGFHSYNSYGEAEYIPMSEYTDDDLYDDVEDTEWNDSDKAIRFANGKMVRVKPSAFKKVSDNGKTRQQNYVQQDLQREKNQRFLGQGRGYRNRNLRNLKQAKDNWEGAYHNFETDVLNGTYNGRNEKRDRETYNREIGLLQQDWDNEKRKHNMK